MASKLPRLLDTASKFALFSVSGFRLKVHKKANLCEKLKHANSILETFEYFCQISSKLILIIFSYTVSKLVRFFETQCTSMIAVHLQSFMASCPSFSFGTDGTVTQTDDHSVWDSLVCLSLEATVISSVLSNALIHVVQIESVKVLSVSSM